MSKPMLENPLVLRLKDSTVIKLLIIMVTSLLTCVKIMIYILLMAVLGMIQ